VRSNFNQLNTLYPEFRSGHLVIIAARPSVGKTTFSLNLLYENSLKRDMRCLFISLEMNSIELLYKLAKIYCSKNFNGSDSENHLMSSIDAVSRDNIFFAKENTASVETIREVALKLLKYDQLDYIVIDYLQLMKSDSFKNRRSYSKHDEVTDISRSLKLLAQELGLPIITLCQLNREVEKRKDKFNRPFLWDLRDSGAIEQDADAVFLLHTIKEDEDNLNSLFDETEDDKLSEGNGVHEKYIPINYQQNEDERHVKLFVEKNRHGGIGEVDLTFNVKEGVFKERIIQWS
jgi:replicative DNA helicase